MPPHAAARDCIAVQLFGLDAMTPPAYIISLATIAVPLAWPKDHFYRRHADADRYARRPFAFSQHKRLRPLAHRRWHQSPSRYSIGRSTYSACWRRSVAGNTSIITRRHASRRHAASPPRASNDERTYFQSPSSFPARKRVSVTACRACFGVEILLNLTAAAKPAMTPRAYADAHGALNGDDTMSLHLSLSRSRAIMTTNDDVLFEAQTTTRDDMRDGRRMAPTTRSHAIFYHDGTGAARQPACDLPAFGAMATSFIFSGR